MTEITLTDLSGNELGQGSSIWFWRMPMEMEGKRAASTWRMQQADGFPDGYMAFSMSVIPVVNDGWAALP